MFREFPRLRELMANKRKAENDELKDETDENSEDELVTKDAEKSDNGVDPSGEAKSDQEDVASQEDGSSTNDDDKQEKKRFKLTPPETCGSLLMCGGTNWDLIGRRDLPKNAKKATGRNLWGPHRLAALKGIRVRFVAAGNSACHTVIITEEGKVMTWGRNDKGQLGHGDLKRRDSPTLVETLKDETIVSAACGKAHTLFIDDRGDVYSCGDNKMGQCGIGTQNSAINVPTRISFKRRPIVKVSCGGEFSMMLDFKGNLFSFGCPEYGQLGHNTDGRYFVSGNKLSFQCEVVPRRVGFFVERHKEAIVKHFENVNIVDVACGLNHTIIVDAQKRCFTWGFGGYGRLGHADPKDEMIPRIVKAFDRPNQGIKSVYAGGSYSCAIDIHGAMYFWGQNKKSGEATMYPKPIQDVTSWHIKQIGCCSRSIVVIADEGCASWGATPTYGELGYGDSKPKSSTTPQEIKPLDGLSVLSVACGYGHSIFIVEDTEEESKKRVDKFPEYTP